MTAGFRGPAVLFMNPWVTLGIAVGLAMDALAVSIASGIAIKKLRLHNALVIGATFGGFQALMPVIGWLAGLTLRDLVSGVDHWIAFVLLAAVGGKMIYESTKLDKAEEPTNPLNVMVLLVLGVATSIDALAVGLTFAFLKINIVAPALIIGGITFALSVGGVFVGNFAGHFFERKMELIGGVILVLIGIKILAGHLGIL